MPTDSPPAPHRAPLIVITGGIGSGKSTVADRFVALGAGLVDTDAIAHELSAPGGAAIEPIRERFGPGAIAPDGRMDRALMRERVFADPSLRIELESILHPLIRAESRQRSALLAARSPYVLVAVPLLVEGGGNWRSRYDRVLVVDCPRSVQIDRVMRRSALEREQAEAILRSQATREERLAVADDVIDNGGDMDALDPQVRALDLRYRALSTAGRGQP